MGNGPSMMRPTSITPRLRVLHCIGGLGGGGAERQLSYLSVALKMKGIDVHIAYRLAGPNTSLIREGGVGLHELRSSGNYDPRLLWELIRTIRTVRPHLIQTWLTQMDVLGGLAAVMTGIPFIMTERSVARAYNGGWKEHLRCWIGRRAALIVANSNSGKEYWLSKKQSDRITVIRNGVPVEDIQRTPPICWETQGLRGPTEILLFAGRYSPEKNLFTLLDAIFLVLSERVNAIALFFGEGPLKSELIAKVKRHGIEDRVRILDYTTQLWSWMKRASVFVSVSIFEGSPNTVLEAAVQGCPLVVSDIPQHRELLGDNAAFFVSPSKAEDIAQGILDALRDPERAKRKAQSAYERASVLTVESITSEYMDVYRVALVQGSFTEGAAEESVGSR
jgi:glycosyltransferase involved in cell wall biosynthesis